MFQFPGFALSTLCIREESPCSTPLLITRGHNNGMSGGLPHSEIHGSKPVPGSPWLIAGYHVLHRLLLPRHPPNALLALDPIQKKTGSRLRPGLVRPGAPLPIGSRTFPLPTRRRGGLVSVLDLDNHAPLRPRPGLPPTRGGRA